jgi:transposase
VSFTHGAGWEGHQKTGLACRVTSDPPGPPVDGIRALQDLGTLPVALLAVSDGWAAAGLTPVAMERPGESWHPRSTLWEGDCPGFLVNAAPGKPGPGRKPAQAEARWLAKLLRQGVLPASFIPPLAPRDRRALTRDRTRLGQARRREVKRGQGVWARANRQRAAGATDSLGGAARALGAAWGEGWTEPATRAAGAGAAGAGTGPSAAVAGPAAGPPRRPGRAGRRPGGREGRRPRQR